MKYYHRKSLYFALTIVIIVAVYKSIVYLGVNMKCKYCYKNGHHYHIRPSLAEKTNHGPMINGKFPHECSICMHNPGKNHYHILT